MRESDPAQPFFTLQEQCGLAMLDGNQKETFVTDLFSAYFCARKNKRNTLNALAYEKHLESNLFNLAEEILGGEYTVSPSICFIVDRPVKREIFAADFRDRVVHHLIYNYIAPIFEKIFINDSYSCRVAKGTHYGINRLDHFIRSCSENYRKEAFVLKLDIQGYFMAMDKELLFRKVIAGIDRYRDRVLFDYPLVTSLIEKTVFNDPRVNCRIKGKRRDWQGLPASKSLFHAKTNCGLPIGNLTSQLFGNVYLNDFDHFVKRDLGIKCYGRYVDDFVLVHNSRDYLKSLVPQIRDYLHRKLRLTLHADKVYLQEVRRGVRFLGAVIKPHRNYIAGRTKGNFYEAIEKHNITARDHKPSKEEMDLFLSSMNSYTGVMKHYRTYRFRRKMICDCISGWWWNYFYVRGGYGVFCCRRRNNR